MQTGDLSAEPGGALLASWWHGAVAAVTGVSLVAQLVLVVADDSPDLLFRLANFVSFFTVQSNIALCAVSTLLAIRPARRSGTVWPVARLDSLICITVTGIVFTTVLRGVVDLDGAAEVLTNAGLHYAAPLAAAAGWLLFGPRPAITWRILGLAMLFPLAWVAYTLVRGEIVEWYPYPFIDVVDLGYGRVAVNIALVTALFLALGAGYLLAERRLPAAPRERGLARR